MTKLQTITGALSEVRGGRKHGRRQVADPGQPDATPHPAHLDGKENKDAICFALTKNANRQALRELSAATNMQIRRDAMLCFAREE
jgi:hypothetical protein